MAPNDTTTSRNAPTPERRAEFADLIKSRRAELRMGLDAFAARAVDPVTGVRVKRGWIYRLESGEPVIPPQVEELRALAEACELALEVLQDAASSQFFGVDPLRSGSSEATAYVRKLDSIPADQRERLLRLIDTLVPPGDDA
ncbi:helix-turn-helix domain-containing protein [Streptomyces sp. NPDC091412]|uniref:helix-turn-helix domain-containing protein n=1 Tax=Streptomyces sp. NPDC091412 TaxID=3366002 RepID=UPI00381C6A74